MAFEGDGTASPLKDLQMGGSWVPVTPAKPNFTNQQLICTEWQQTFPAPADWPNSVQVDQVKQANQSNYGKLPQNFAVEIPAQTGPGCSASINSANGGFNTWQVGEAATSQVYTNTSQSFDIWGGGDATSCGISGGNLQIDDRSILNDNDMCTNMTFESLFALAHADPVAAAVPEENAVTQTDFAAKSSTFHSLIAYNQWTTGIGNSSAPDSNNLLLENSTPHLQCDGTLGLSRPFFDLNLPATITTDEASSKSISFQFDPITPAKTNKMDMQEPDIENLPADSVPTPKEGQKETTTGEVNRHDKRKRQSVSDRLCATRPKQLQENDKPDSGGREEADLSKTPQQNPRRKKHRPKVVIEGQTTTPRGRKPSVLHEARVKRKYVRKKGVNNSTNSPMEGETDGTYANIKASTSVDTPVVQRKYRRRKGNDQPEVAIHDGSTEIMDESTIRRTRGSCRRTLIFNSGGQVRDEDSLYYISLDSDMELQAENSSAKEQSKTTVECQKQAALTMGGYLNDMDVAYGPTHPIDQFQEIRLSRTDKHSPSPLLPTKTDSLPDCRPAHYSMRGKCQVVFSDVTHDKETNTVQVSVNPDEWLTDPNSINRSTPFTSEREARGLKRQHMSTIAEADICSSDATGTSHNFRDKYLPIFLQNAYSYGMYFPKIFKKKRTTKVLNPATSSLQSMMTAPDGDVKLQRHHPADSFLHMRSSRTNQGSTIAPFEAINPPTHNPPVCDSTQSGRQISVDLLAMGSCERIKRKRSKLPIRVRDLASLRETWKELPVAPRRAANLSKSQYRNEVLHEPDSCIKALLADSCSRMTTKKRSKRRLHVDSTRTNLFYHQEFTGFQLALTWRCMPTVDSITNQLKRLDLNAEVSPMFTQKQKTLMGGHMQYQEQHALVPYHGGGALVPFDDSFDQSRRTRPKVDLDAETTRVWKLLLENIDSEGIDGTDEENMNRWEEERRVFHGRAESFIARMHLVQGDRRFSPWKGSVVDSVVGVFLTQNVSDHLSSSAFMALASHFPIEVPNVANSGPVISNECTPNKSTSLIGTGIDTDEAFSSHTSAISSQNSADSSNVQTKERTESCSHNNSEEEAAAGSTPNRTTSSTSFIRLLQMAGTVLHGVYGEDGAKKGQDDYQHVQSKKFLRSRTGDQFGDPTSGLKPNASCSKSTSDAAPSLVLQKDCLNSSNKFSKFSDTCSRGHSAEGSSGLSEECATNSRAHISNEDTIEKNPTIDRKQKSQIPVQSLFEEQELPDIATYPEKTTNSTGSGNNIHYSSEFEHKEVNSNRKDRDSYSRKTSKRPKPKRGRVGKEKHNEVDWDDLRKQAEEGGRKRERTANTMDSVDWDAVRCADVNEIAQIIKERGMNNMLAARIKDFLNRVVRDHGSIDLEWLRDVQPDKAKEYLLSIRGLGLKSVECVRLLTLHHLAFPVDTNVGRIAVRLGWVPLQPLPESMQLHLLELYPIMETVQKYLWPRLCKLDQRTLYELHYQMITFGKVFCTKSKPNCNACPMRGDCRHFASAFASARLALPAPEEKSIITTKEHESAGQHSMEEMHVLQLPSPPIPRTEEIYRGTTAGIRYMNTLLLPSSSFQANGTYNNSGASTSQAIIEEPPTPEPIIDIPATPEYPHLSECDIEDMFYEDPEEIPTIQFNMDQFTQNLQEVVQNTDMQESDVSKALVALTTQAASIPAPKLKNVSRLRTEHQVYELPDSHPLLEGVDRREPDDPCPYLLAIWTPGETVDSIKPPERRCSSEVSGKLCKDETCMSCNGTRERNSQTVRGTLLIPCRTAMRGSFPLNGTYFQVNEVFSDHESSQTPLHVPRDWLWNLPRRTVYFGTSIPTIFRGLTTAGIQYCFWRGFVCVRGFDRKARAPRPLIPRLHFPASKLAKGKEKTDDD